MTEPASPPKPCSESNGALLQGKPHRGMLGFYLAMGALLALAVGFVFAWAPLRVWYYERQFLRISESAGLNTDILSEFAAQKLVRVGPVATPALKRILAGGDIRRRSALVNAITTEHPGWAVELLVEECRRSEDLDTRLFYVGAVEHITRDKFLTNEGVGGINRRNDAQWRSCQVFLDWWDREGRSKYGRSEQ